jgi:DNA-binding transcriptional ArsR family regulator
VELLSATSPIWELVTGLRAASDAEARRLPEDDIVLLPALVRRATVVPHFLLPPPEQAHPTFDEEVERVAALPAEQILTELGYAFSGARRRYEAEAVLPRQLAWVARTPELALERLVWELRRAWKLTLAQGWARAEDGLCERAQLVGEVLRQDMAGVVTLDPAYSFDGRRLRAANLPDGRRTIKNARLVFVATGAGSAPSSAIDCHAPGIAWGERPAMLAYAAAGVQSRLEQQPRGDRLAAVVGPRRADLLRALRTSRTTTDLAEELRLTPGAVSQQLAQLQRAGLLERTPDHPYVRYRLSARGEALVDLLMS